MSSTQPYPNGGQPQAPPRQIRRRDLFWPAVGSVAAVLGLSGVVSRWWADKQVFPPFDWTRPQGPSKTQLSPDLARVNTLAFQNGVDVLNTVVPNGHTVHDTIVEKNFMGTPPDIARRAQMTMAQAMDRCVGVVLVDQIQPIVGSNGTLYSLGRYSPFGNSCHPGIVPPGQHLGYFVNGHAVQADLRRVAIGDALDNIRINPQNNAFRGQPSVHLDKVQYLPSLTAPISSVTDNNGVIIPSKWNLVDSTSGMGGALSDLGPLTAVGQIYMLAGRWDSSPDTNEIDGVPQQLWRVIDLRMDVFSLDNTNVNDKSKWFVRLLPNQLEDFGISGLELPTGGPIDIRLFKHGDPQLFNRLGYGSMRNVEDFDTSFEELVEYSAGKTRGTYTSVEEWEASGHAWGIDESTGQLSGTEPSVVRGNWMAAREQITTLSYPSDVKPYPYQKPSLDRTSTHVDGFPPEPFHGSEGVDRSRLPGGDRFGQTPSPAPQPDNPWGGTITTRRGLFRGLLNPADPALATPASITAPKWDSHMWEKGFVDDLVRRSQGLSSAIQRSAQRTFDTLTRSTSELSRPSNGPTL